MGREKRQGGSTGSFVLLVVLLAWLKAKSSTNCQRSQQASTLDVKPVKPSPLTYGEASGKKSTVLEVRRSNEVDAGFGLFAKTSLAAGSVLGAYTGRVLTYDEAVDSTSDRLSEFATRPLWISQADWEQGRRIIDCESIVGYANAADYPSREREANAYLRHDGYVILNRDVAANEEILWNYGAHYWSTEFMAAGTKQAQDERKRQGDDQGEGHAKHAARTRWDLLWRHFHKQTAEAVDEQGESHAKQAARTKQTARA